MEYYLGAVIAFLVVLLIVHTYLFGRRDGDEHVGLANV
jgi:hypothetical protein